MTAPALKRPVRLRPVRLRPASSRPRRQRRAALSLGAVGVALSLVLAACGGGEKEAAEKPESQPVEGGTKLAALWPLTGLEVTGSTPDRPVLVAKIDNSASSQPQVGLKKADLITEVLVEGGITRLAVFFYSQLPGVIGPVRSMRTSDVGIVKPAHGVLVASGAAPTTIGRLKAADITYFTEGGPGYFREGSRRAPYNLMVNLGQLAKTVRKKAVVPASYLPWGKAEDFAGGRPAKQVDAIFSRSHTTSWRFQGGKYLNVNSYAAADGQFQPENLLVLRVKQKDAGYLDPGGNRVPETVYSGQGSMMLFHGGQVVRGTWNKTSNQSPLKLRTKAGELTVPAGRTWIELVPTDQDGGRVAFRP